jgi:aquaporin Z
MSSSLRSCFVAEFVGTFLLVFTICCCHFAGDANWDATAVACILMVSVYAFTAVSGGHFNPAVSLACGLMSRHRLYKYKAVVYILAQFLGAFAATGACYSVFERTMPLSYVEGNRWWCACVVEMVYTGMLCFVVLNCAVSKRNNPKDDGKSFYGLAIGFVIVAGGYACGGISGAAFNPAVAITVDISHTGMNAKWGFIYSLYELVGAFIAAILFAICHPEDCDDNMDSAALENYRPAMYSRMLSEFLGTFVLTLTIGLCMVNKSPVTAWAAAASLMCMIYAVGNISGGHFNPAVTLAVVLSRRKKCKPLDGLVYACIQLLAGGFAGVLVSHLHRYGKYSDEVFGLQPQAHWSWLYVLFAEFLFTAVLAFVVLACGTVADTSVKDTNSNFYFALAIGSAVTVGGFSIGAISGGFLNPAVAFGISIAAAFGDATAPPFIYCIYFSLVQVAGGHMAAILFYATHVKYFEVSDPDGFDTQHSSSGQ